MTQTTQTPSSPPTRLSDEARAAKASLEKGLGLRPGQFGVGRLLIEICLRRDDSPTCWRLSQVIASQPLKSNAEIEGLLLQLDRYLNDTQAFDELEDFVARQRFDQLGCAG